MIPARTIWLTAALLTSGTGGASGQDGPVARWAFDEGRGATAIESVSGTEALIAHRAGKPEWARGAVGKALRLDGYSTWLEAPLPAERQPRTGLTVSAWVALEANPVSNAAFASQYTYPTSGWFFGLDKHGKWYLSVSVQGTWHTCWGGGLLPKGRWVHVAGTYDHKRGLAVYLNGQEAGREEAFGEITPEPEVKLTVGKDAHSPAIRDLFPTGALNGLIDEVRVYDRALSPEDIRALHAAADPPAAPDLRVPEDRFAGDSHRPVYHPIPDAAWTNEPHGLVRFGDAWHVFFQKNPNGPYWEQIHWGHLASRDLVRWDEWPIALAPEMGFDQRGIWSGDAVVHDGTPTLVYTGVDGVKAAVGLATSADGGRTWTKYPKNPVIPGTPPGFLDFRDPYLWREDETWYLIIGSGVPEKGGTALLYRSTDLVDWTYLKPLMMGRQEESGIFWEMPVLVPLGANKHMLYVTTVEKNAPARGLYWLGTWKAGTFKPDSERPQPLDVINHMLSPAVAPTEDGKALAMGIVPEMRRASEVAKAGWSHVFSLPRLLSLAPDGTLRQEPAPELRRLRGKPTRIGRREIAPDTLNLLDATGDTLEIQAEIEPGSAEVFGLRLRCSPDGAEETDILYDRKTGTIRVEGARPEEARNGRQVSGAFALRNGEPLRLRVFLDRSVMEVFINDRAAFSTRVYPARPGSVRIGLYAAGGTATLKGMEVWPMGNDRATGAQITEKGEAR